MKEVLTSSSKSLDKIVTWYYIGIGGGLYFRSVIYDAVGGRFSERIREGAVKFMKEQSFFRGDDFRKSWILRCWSRKDRMEAITEIEEGLGWKEARDKYYDEMSDKEIRSRAMGLVKAFKEAVRPREELLDRRN